MVVINDYYILKREDIKGFVSQGLEFWKDIDDEHLEYIKKDTEELLTVDYDAVILVERPMDDFVMIAVGVYNKSSAVDFAKEIQYLMSGAELSYGEIAYINDILVEIGKKYNLTEEFVENGVI